MRIVDYRCEMKAAQHRDRPGRHDLVGLARKFESCFPKLDEDARWVALTLYRLLAKGEPVALSALANASGIGTDRVAVLLASWPGVYREKDRVIGFWGLTPRKFSAHRFEVDGRTLYTWCAWDSLFIPAILRRTATVISEDPQTGEAIRLASTPEGVRDVDPNGVAVSMLEPDENTSSDVVARLCHCIHFFASEESARRWAADHSGISVVSLDEAFELGRIANHERYGGALFREIERD